MIIILSGEDRLNISKEVTLKDFPDLDPVMISTAKVILFQRGSETIILKGPDIC